MTADDELLTAALSQRSAVRRLRSAVKRDRDS